MEADAIGPAGQTPSGSGSGISFQAQVTTYLSDRLATDWGTNLGPVFAVPRSLEGSDDQGLSFTPIEYADFVMTVARVFPRLLPALRAVGGERNGLQIQIPRTLIRQLLPSGIRFEGGVTEGPAMGRLDAEKVDRYLIDMLPGLVAELPSGFRHVPHHRFSDLGSEDDLTALEYAYVIQRAAHLVPDLLPHVHASPNYQVVISSETKDRIDAAAGTSVVTAEPAHQTERMLRRPGDS